MIQALNEYGEVLPENEVPPGKYAHACSLDGPVMYIQVSFTFTTIIMCSYCVYNFL